MNVLENNIYHRQPGLVMNDAQGNPNKNISNFEASRLSGRHHVSISVTSRANNKETTENSAEASKLTQKTKNNNSLPHQFTMDNSKQYETLADRLKLISNNQTAMIKTPQKLTSQKIVANFSNDFRSRNEKNQTEQRLIKKGSTSSLNP